MPYFNCFCVFLTNIKFYRCSPVLPSMMSGGGIAGRGPGAGPRTAPGAMRGPMGRGDYGKLISSSR